MKKLGAYLFNLWLAFDMAVNTLFGGRPGETLSLRFARAAAKGLPVGCVMCRLLSQLDPDHCRKTIAHQIERARAILADDHRRCEALS